MTGQVLPPPSKLDAEPLVLRGSSGHAIRFRRSVVLTIAVAAMTLVLLASWFALRAPAPRGSATDEPRTISDGSPAEELANAPATYSDIPHLGPPLPGDLGKPILEHEGAQEITASGPAAAAAIDAERQQLRAQGKAARESGLLVRDAKQAQPLVPPPADEGRPTQLATTSGSQNDRPALDANADPNAQVRKESFASRTDDVDVDPHRLRPPSGPPVLAAGSVIAASLITGLRSDLPGVVTAQVTENVFDSATGDTLLVPQGARLIGTYDSVIAFGQRRAFLIWQRIVFPDGSSVHIDNVQATDPSGYTGLADKVDFHSWMLLKGVVLSTLLGVSSNLALSGQGDLVQAIRMSTQDSVSRAGDQITSRNLQVQPTITIRPGTTVRLVVHHDLVLAPWQSGSVR
jgi:type IV secretion system protein VirB10